MESVVNGKEYPPVPEDRNYDSHREAISELKRPNIDRNIDIKARVSTLENTVLYQAEVNPLTVSMLDDLNLDIFKCENKVMSVIEVNQQKIVEEMIELKRNYDHRFEMQAADNVRSLQHFSTLKAENNQLRRKLETTSKKLRALQAEFDGGETADMDNTDTYSRTPSPELRIHSASSGFEDLN
eukprot:CAMPEP_0119049028 /NCGR_PEP_ID=MMETSP1177-20130426/62341_1 /TAXON_ID=2985 /ORGANISM="Ochromonas sp, Strain CCMP1899" /LENGTH=182 /DNA_ID=CAMNT_0007025713 /DNA_START=160 /DNA_END=708 /DNA_ORIENTATION=+